MSALIIPSLQILTHSVPNVTVKIIDKPSIFQNRNKFSRRNVSILLAFPAAKSLCTSYHPSLIVDLWLIPYLYFPRLNSCRKATCDTGTFPSHVPLLWVIKLKSFFLGFSDFSFCNAGIIKHLIHVYVFIVIRHKNINTRAEPYNKVFSTIAKIIANRSQNIFFILKNLFIAANTSKDNKMISIIPSYSFFIGKYFKASLSPKF